MKTLTENKSKTLSKFLETLRDKRGFDAEIYTERKAYAINKFFRENNLDCAVIGLSGGVDSAVAFSLLEFASRRPDSPIKKILALAMPIYGNGTTNQTDATNKATRFITNFLGTKRKRYNDKVEFEMFDLSHAYESYQYGHETDAWSNGQLASIVRTPFLYYNAALLQTKGYKSIVVGTTNRDEGSYIGFFGKASDAMVDLQPIADIHKSEVYQVAKLLEVSDEIINATPAGDVHDGRVDEEMIGAPYWFLELFLLQKQYKETAKLETFEDGEIYGKYYASIESIHEKNKHKYQVGSPAHFIDVMERKIEGGWQ